MTKKAAILVLLILSTVYCSAQFVSFGQDRASLRWKQIKTDRFQIIYPDFFEKNAQKAACTTTPTPCKSLPGKYPSSSMPTAASPTAT